MLGHACGWQVCLSLKDGAADPPPAPWAQSQAADPRWHPQLCARRGRGSLLVLGAERIHLFNLLSLQCHISCIDKLILYCCD